MARWDVALTMVLLCRREPRPVVNGVDITWDAREHAADLQWVVQERNHQLHRQRPRDVGQRRPRDRALLVQCPACEVAVLPPHCHPPFPSPRACWWWSWPARPHHCRSSIQDDEAPDRQRRVASPGTCHTRAFGAWHAMPSPCPSHRVTNTTLTSNSRVEAERGIEDEFALRGGDHGGQPPAFTARRRWQRLSPQGRAARALTACRSAGTPRRSRQLARANAAPVSQGLWPPRTDGLA